MAIRVVWAVLVVSTACTIRVVDAVRRILIAITAIGIGDAIGVIGVGIQVATNCPWLLNN